MAEAAAPAHQAQPESQGSKEWCKKVLCRYYLHGACREGDRCSYSHDVQNRSAAPSLVCRYYLKGQCTYGDKCRYDHVKPKDAKSKPDVARKSNALTPAPLLDSSGPKSSMVSLKSGSAATPPTTSRSLLSAQAAEFVPGEKWASSSVPNSYAAAAGGSEEGASTSEDLANELCPYALHGQCRYGEECVYLHGEVCDLCGQQALHPNNVEMREKHVKECVEQHGKDMEHSFAVQRSAEKTCGICMDVVWEKEPPSKRKFGILSACTHVFCLECIRKWRSAKQFEHKIVKACPECRVKSDFVTPSQFWVEEEKDKEQLISGYKQALSTKPCRYFDQGRGECPFNNHCFYLHAYPDGRKASPVLPRKRRQNSSGSYDLIQEIILWDFLEERRNTFSNFLDQDEEFLTDLFLNLSITDLLSLDSDDDSDSDY